VLHFDNEDNKKRRFNKFLSYSLLLFGTYSALPLYINHEHYKLQKIISEVQRTESCITMGRTESSSTSRTLYDYVNGTSQVHPETWNQNNIRYGTRQLTWSKSVPPTGNKIDTSYDLCVIYRRIYSVMYFTNV
jgi:hypothetical protein